MDLVAGSGGAERSQDFAVSWVFGMHRPETEDNVSQWERQRAKSVTSTLM